jgi:hypothetical protein
MDGACCAHAEMRNAYKSLIGKSEGTRPLGRPRSTSKENIEMNLREIGLGMWAGFI